MLLDTGRVWRMKDLLAEGIAATTVRRAVSAGTIEAIAKGTYRKAGIPVEPNEAIAAVSSRVPEGVIWLLSAASYHGLADTAPSEVWIALPMGRRKPRIEWPPVRTVHWRQPLALELGVETSVVHGVEVKITNRARTLVDVLRSVDTVGDTRAMQCLRAYGLAGGSAEEARVIAGKLGWGERLEPYFKTIPFYGAPHEKQRRGHPGRARDKG